MDAERFDDLARTLVTVTSRRGALAGVVSSLAAALPVALAADEAAAKKKKKKPCPPCTKRKKGKCKATLPDGTACTGGTCQDGSCIAASVDPPRGGCPNGEKPCDGGCIPSSQCCNNADCQISGQTCTAARQCACPAALPEICGGACLVRCNADQARDPNGCRCCIRNGLSPGNTVSNCCSQMTTGGICAGRSAGQGCQFDEQCATENCVQGKCSGCRKGWDYCDHGATCSNGDGQCLRAVDGTKRCGVGLWGNEGDCGWCTRDFDCDQGVNPGYFCAVDTGPNCGCAQGQTFCARPA